jgi:tetratricopeptide (TPR) repeat protein
MNLRRLLVGTIGAALVVAAGQCGAEAVMDGAVRVLRVRVAADDELRARADWEQVVRDHLQFASDYYEKTFDIRFDVQEIVAWDSDDESAGLGDLVDELEKTIPVTGVDVVIGLSAQRPKPGKLSKYVGLPTGLTPSLGRVSLVRVMPDDENYDLRLALIHEVAHLFGAFHTAQQDSIMRESVQGPRTFQIDVENGKMVRLLRLFDFEKGVEGLDEDTLKRMTGIWERGGIPGDANPVAEALFNVGVEKHDQGQVEEAIKTWRRAAAYDKTYAQPHGSIGLALASLKRYDEALRELQIADRLGCPEAKQAIEMVKHQSAARGSR